MEKRTPIRILPDHVAVRIAAGEVVERPASVMKELVENAIDSGAGSISVAVRGDGRSFLSVADDGCGIPPAELPLALSRHGTSKVPGDDLRSVATLGFRGEALASIAAAARLSVVSRVASEDCAWMLDGDQSDAGRPRPASLAQGTRVEVRDLFRAIPARLKFLKSVRAETAVLRECFAMLALANPGVAMELTGGQHPTRHAVDSDDLDEGRTRSVMGAGFMDDALRLDFAHGGVRVSGWACVPTRNRADAKEQAFFVNGRHVRDRVLASALRAAYSGLLAKGRQPCAVVHVHVDPARVDVNVHPRKQEVRFSDEAAVAEAVRGAVRGTLESSGIRTSVEVAREALDAIAAGGEVASGDRRRLPLGNVIGQAHSSFIISETLDGVAVVDQHAAHERILLERMKAAALAGAVAARPLSPPLRVALPPVQAALAAECAAELARLGLVLRPCGSDAVLVERVPQMLGPLDVAGLVAEVASALEEDPSADILGECLEEICSLIACHNAIRAEDVLDAEAADTLLREMESCVNVSQCNHGRPTVVFLSRRQIESLFERR